MIIVAELSSVWLRCLPQKPWFYDIWQTWVGYPFQVSFLAPGRWPPGIPGISPLEGIIYSSLFPPHGHHLQRCGTKSCPFREVLPTAAGLPWDLPVLQVAPPAPTPGYQLLTGDVISAPRLGAEPLHCPRPHGASRHPYCHNNPAPSHCLPIPVLGRGQEYK